MTVTIEINKTLVQSYKDICEYLKQNPNRTDWVSVRQKLEREITESVINQIKEK